MSSMLSVLANITRNMISGRCEADQKLWAEEVLGLDTDLLPARYFLERPRDKGSYVLPVKQSFIKDARLMPGTRCFLALLTVWALTGRPLEVTKETIAKHLRRSVRQIYRYLKDAQREGYLRYVYTKNRMGMITGLKIYLNLWLLRPNLKRKPRIKPENPARTPASNTNTLIKDSYLMEPEIGARLDRLRQAAGFAPA